MTYWYDGQLIEEDKIVLEITHLGLIYGANTFTTLRIYNQQLNHPLTHWSAHLNRLKNSLKTFGWSFNHWSRLQTEVEILGQTYPILRIVIFPDEKEWITGRYLTNNLSQLQQQGVRGWVAQDRLFARSLESHKTGNYLGAWLALQKAQEYDAREGILVDSHQNWLESCTGNLWGWKAGKWYTPNVNSILPGIVRSHLITWLNQNKIPVVENQWTPKFIQDLDSIAYSNCGVEVIPFSQIINGDKVHLFDPSHPRLQDLFSYFQVYHSEQFL